MAEPRAASHYRLCVGVDSAAASFDASWLRADGQLTSAQTFPQTTAGFAAFQQQLETAGVRPAQTLLVLEATGSSWVALATSVHAAGYAVAIVNPAQAHHYAKSSPRRNTTDARDAQLLARFAAERRPDPWTPPPMVYHEVRQRLVARDGRLEMRQQARNQLHALEQWPVQVVEVHQHMLQVITTLDQHIRSLEAAIAQVVADGAWAHSAAHVQSVPGMGLVTAAWLLVSTVNFTTCTTPEAAAHYAGLTPLERQSGTSIRGRPRIGHGGNERLRTALYMATLSAARYNPMIKSFYTRLRDAGKPPKVARCAAARKLLHLAFAVVTKRQDFAVSYQKPPSLAWDEA